MHLKETLSKRATDYHGKIPWIKKLPIAAVGIILAVALANAVIWAAVGVVLVSGSPCINLQALARITYNPS